MFNDTKHRAVSLQELSFLSCNVVKLKRLQSCKLTNIVVKKQKQVTKNDTSPAVSGR